MCSRKPFSSCVLVTGHGFESLLALPGELTKGSTYDSCWLGLRTLPSLCSVWPRWVSEGSCKAWKRAERGLPLLKVNVTSVEVPAESPEVQEAVFGGAERVTPWHVPIAPRRHPAVRVTGRDSRRVWAWRGSKQALQGVCRGKVCP